MADDRPWICLSAEKIRVEVFRMTEEDRISMDVMRISSDRIELMRGVLDGPAWIGGTPSSIGVTQDGVTLWDPEKSWAGRHDKPRPDWAVRYADAIAREVEQARATSPLNDG